jgi:hypothetical protein
MPLQFYKPNRGNTGAACSFNLSKERKIAFLSFIKQHSWNEATKNGSFSGNKGNPLKSVDVKLGILEMSGIVDALERNEQYETWFNSAKQKGKVTIKPYSKVIENAPVQIGYSLGVIKNIKGQDTQGISFIIGLTFPEARALRQFLLLAIDFLLVTESLSGEPQSQVEQQNKPSQEAQPQQESQPPPSSGDFLDETKGNPDDPANREW